MQRLPRCAEAMRKAAARRSCIFEDASKADLVERNLLFSPTTKTGVILPFATEDGLQGALLIGEERDRSRSRLTERLTVLDLMAQRLGAIVSVAQVLERRNVAKLKRQTRIVELTERRQLARGAARRRRPGAHGAFDAAPDRDPRGRIELRRPQDL